MPETGVYRIRSYLDAHLVLELKDGKTWGRVQLAKLNTTNAAQTWKLSQVDGQWIFDNESSDNQLLSPLADNSHSQLFSSGLKPNNNEILRWKLSQYEDGSFRIENAAFHGQVVDLQEAKAQPEQPVITFPYRDENVGSGSLPWLQAEKKGFWWLRTADGNI
ncbi:hypothetical protein N7516_010684 [Penicillium verrucosum]|uniref:uncharacterized protein n=1 Tax=Penicillium verrucosum TaxID=60171 RepID=UPI0025458189|nr:uncharacterized protein N7516_010684 [Penicillium verrucosum]KAJ5922981.1 hypothetical protein N7516_010684 [Penicillium verrucosum]